MQWQFLVEFSPCESCYFSILRAILLKLHIFAHLIESYSTVYGLSSCIEIIMSIRQAAHTTVTMYARRAVIFCIFECSYSSVLRPIPETAYFNLPNRELFSGVWVMELYWNRNVDPSRSPCFKIVIRKSFEHRNFLLFRPVLHKIAYFTSANRQPFNAVWSVELR